MSSVYTLIINYQGFKLLRGTASEKVKLLNETI